MLSSLAIASKSSCPNRLINRVLSSQVLEADDRISPRSTFIVYPRYSEVRHTQRFLFRLVVDLLRQILGRGWQID